MTTEIPVIDVSVYGLGVKDINAVGEDQLQGVANEVCGAFSGIGFCYISNHGISGRLIQRMKDASLDFFQQADDVKCQFARPAEQNNGYLAMGREKVSDDRPSDLKEAFNYSPSNDDGNWPEYPEDFEETVKEFYDQCRTLTLRLLDLISLGLNLPHKEYLRQRHGHIGQTDNPTMVRSLYYPPMTSTQVVTTLHGLLMTVLKCGQIRCGEHTDYGIMTLLFQDEQGGLEVKNVKGEYIPAKPIPGTVLINLGDMMQHWTADKLKATEHRVVFPDHENSRQHRQSVAFFVHPDDNVIISCLDNSNKYPPIYSVNHLTQRLKSTIADDTDQMF